MPLDGNEFFQLVLKACLQLENNDPQRSRYDLSLRTCLDSVKAYTANLLLCYLQMLYLVTYLH